MKKTIEEMRVAVLAYCEEVCPNEHNKAHLQVGMLKRQSMGSVFYWLHVDGLSTIAIHDNATDDHIFAAYRLLGLETRDAVAAEKRETERVRTSLNHAIALKNEQIQKRLIESNADRNDLEAIIDHERARNTALVEALDQIKEEHGYRYTYGDGFGNVTEKRLSSLGVAIDLLIAANTEKGGVNEKA